MAFENVFKIGDGDRGCDSIEATLHRTSITLEIEEPWAGCTETGFGQSCTITLNAAEARALAAWLTHAAIVADATGFLETNPDGDFQAFIASRKEAAPA